jgi:hypothetical protein
VVKVRRWHVAVLLLALVALTSLSGITSWPDQLRGMRSVTEQEELFRYVAQELAEPSICEKIPWSVETDGGFFTASSYERSECYASIAGRTKNPWICWRVRRLGAYRFIGDQTSMWSCLRGAWHGMNSGIGVSPASLAGFFSKLGYDSDTLQLEGVTPPVISVKDVYRQLPNRTDIVMRIQKAVDVPARFLESGESDEAMDIAYLADMAALVTKDARWCARIPENVQLTSQSARFRDWCVFTLASNTGDAQLCRTIAIHENEGDPRLSLRANCVRQSTSRYPHGQYGPEVPNDDSRAGALISALSYEIPRSKDLPIEEIAAAYERFLQELGRGSDRVHLSARQRFIQRVRALPESN